MSAQSIRIGAGMSLAKRLLWYLGWNPRPLYIIAGCFAVFGAVIFQSPLGILFGLIPLGGVIRAIFFIKQATPHILDLAKIQISKLGAERVGVPFETSDPRVFLIAEDSRTFFGVLPAVRCTASCVYIADEFFAIFLGSSFALITRSISPAKTAEEVYFRHVSAINQHDDAIEITLTRAAKPKRIPTGTDVGSSKLLATLRARLRSPKVVPTPPSPIVHEPVQKIAVSLNASDADERYCYIRASKLMDYYSDPTVLSALMEQLQVPGTVAMHNQMSELDKKTAIEAQIDHFRQTPTSFWYGATPYEILAASIWRTGGQLLSERVMFDKFYDVAREEDLRRPVARWLETINQEPYMEIQLGRRRIDVLGHRKTKGSPRLTAVELKNSDEQFRRGPDQMGTFAEYAHAVYLACTPAFAAEYLERNAEHRSVNHWDASLLDRKLKQGGFGLLIVERDNVFEVIKPLEQNPSEEKVAKIIRSLPALHRIDLD
jgi:hypothetical protein